MVEMLAPLVNQCFETATRARTTADRKRSWAVYQWVRALYIRHVALQGSIQS
jgi:hypothetical protein